MYFSYKAQVADVVFLVTSTVGFFSTWENEFLLEEAANHFGELTKQ